MIHKCYMVFDLELFGRIYIYNVVKSKIIFALHSFAQKCVSGRHFLHFCTNIARCCAVAKIFILSAPTLDKSGSVVENNCARLSLESWRSSRE